MKIQNKVQEVEEIKNFNLLRKFNIKPIVRLKYQLTRKRRGMGLALIVGKDDIARAFIVPLKEKFKIKNEDYGINKKCIYKINNIPFTIYPEGNFDPVNINNPEYSSISGKNMRELFLKSKLSGKTGENNLIIILLLCSLAGIAFLVLLLFKGGMPT